MAVSGSAVTLTLASAVAADETVTVGYTVPADAEAARIEDAAGNAAAGFTGQAVTNETAGPPAAALSVGEAAAQAGQFGVRIAFAEAVTGLAVEDLGAERVGGSAAAVSELTEAETGRVWTATVAAADAGRYLVRLAAGAVQAGARQSLADGAGGRRRRAGQRGGGGRSGGDGGGAGAGRELDGRGHGAAGARVLGAGDGGHGGGHAVGRDRARRRRAVRRPMQAARARRRWRSPTR